MFLKRASFERLRVSVDKQIGGGEAGREVGIRAERARTSPRPMVNGQWSMVNGRLSMVECPSPAECTAGVAKGAEGKRGRGWRVRGCEGARVRCEGDMLWTGQRWAPA
jgi:hypothetical protein